MRRLRGAHVAMAGSVSLPARPGTRWRRRRRPVRLARSADRHRPDTELQNSDGDHGGAGRPRSRPASANSTVCSAGDWSPDRRFFSAAIRGSASPRSCCRRPMRLSRDRTVALCLGRRIGAPDRASRAERSDSHRPSLRLIAETRVESILDEAAAAAARVLIVDSIQTVQTEASESSTGSASQVRESAARLVRHAKDGGAAVFLIGHVTKEGVIAGPRILEHMVDTVLYFESDPGSRYRVIRAVKNRFGAANEIGVFAMAEQGLREVRNPSAIFLSRRSAPGAGQRRHGRTRRYPPVAGRGPGAARRRPGRRAAPRRRGARHEPHRAAARGIASARRSRNRGSRCVRQRRRRRADRRDGGGPAGRACRRIEPAWPTAAPPISSPSASSDSRARSGPCPSARSVCARRPSRDLRARSCRPATRRADRSRASSCDRRGPAPGGARECVLRRGARARRRCGADARS